MSADEKMAVLARAILQLAEEAATAWDYDGEQMIGRGVTLDLASRLRSIAEEGGEPIGPDGAKISVTNLTVTDNKRA